MQLFKNTYLRIAALVLVAGVAIKLLMCATTYITPDLAAYWAKFTNDYRVYAVPITAIDFAGEAVPLSDFEVRERLDKEILVNVYWQSATMQAIKRANRYFPEIEKILIEENIPTDFKYLAVIESGLANVVSPAGATGFWQIMPATAKENGLLISDEIDERYDPIKSTRAACKYLKNAYRKFGNWTMVAASYNAGVAGMQRAATDQQDANYYNLLLNTETSRYLMRILALKAIMQHPHQYGFRFRGEDLYKPLKYSEVTVDTTITNLVSYARSMGITYKHLKLYNAQLRTNRLTANTAKPYILHLPNADDLRNGKLEENTVVPQFDLPQDAPPAAAPTQKQ
jgi:hypothetical protein